MNIGLLRIEEINSFEVSFDLTIRASFLYEFLRSKFKSVKFKGSKEFLGFEYAIKL